MSNFHDKIASLCLNKFKSLPKTGKPNENEWTILSCIVQESNSSFKVVALGTGTKCIGIDKMSNLGDVLNDSHAEVICRRTFLRYLYENLLDNKKDQLFEAYSNQRFQLKNEIKFHFFTTHVPCGDAAIFPKQSNEDFGDLQGIDEPKTKKIKLSCDIFRTGAKCLESDTIQDLKLLGSDYHRTGLVRTKPGRGVKTLSVSCSDKMAKWCHLGIQGALLTILVEKPIYFSSFTIIGGTPFCPTALNRALFNRFEPKFRKKNLMPIGQSNYTFEFCKIDGKYPCGSSISWLETTTKQTEVAVEGRKQGLTKKQLQKNGGRLKINKKQFFIYFKQIVEKYKINIGRLETLSYKQVKMLSIKYQNNWKTMKREGFKIWTDKEESLLEFSCD